MGLTPKSKPQLPSVDVRKLAAEVGITVNKVGHVAVFAIRGYFLNSMGVKGKNDRGLYDDAAWIILHDRCIPFNFNTDPTGYQHGRATYKGNQLSFAIPGKHHLSSPPPKGRAAFRQWGTVTVVRDGVGDSTGDFGINIHDGGETTTSSEGCLTVPPAQWKDFRNAIFKELGVTEDDCMHAHPAGVPGKQFPRYVMERDEAVRILGREF